MSESANQQISKSANRQSKIVNRQIGSRQSPIANRQIGSRQSPIGKSAIENRQSAAYGDSS